jgi:hypothetical protein
MRYLAVPPLALLSLVGCSAPGGTAGPLIDPGPAPENGFQIVLPVQKALEPGSSHELCTWTDFVADRDLDVRSVEGWQSPGGHHVVLYATKIHQEANLTRECRDEDMLTFTFITGTAGGEGSSHDVASAPGNLAFRIPAGAQVVLNHHYINASPKPLDAQSAMNVLLAEPGKSYVRSGWMFFSNTRLMLPPGTPTLDIHCTMPKPVSGWWLAPHLHRWGTRATVDITHENATARLFDLAWKGEYTFHPPAIEKDPAAPLVLAEGDQVDLHCEWNIPGPDTFTFGKEMCALGVQTVDAGDTPNIACDDGHWNGF